MRATLKKPTTVMSVSVLFSEVQWGALGSALKLCPRESQFLLGVSEDLKDATIASRLGIAPNTLRTYVKRLYLKLGVSSRPQLLIKVFHTHLRLISSKGPGT